ncbi:protein RALF-like 19 [Abrus precatorius]|uniref:Protein RALF-like 19 n=1 Tax=Abrus precatorius TaxID=3816 RepID=A0A8B8KVH0_ABRPR|nr:protein RALF-like 19 [Abrus precatorius]
MNFKPWLVLFLLALALAMVAEASKADDFSLDGVVGDLIGEDNEMMLDSESNRRTLAARRQRYISYAALRANQVPCGRRGRSYYSCQQRGRANPYRRGCSVITHCARDTS